MLDLKKAKLRGSVSGYRVLPRRSSLLPRRMLGGTIGILRLLVSLLNVFVWLLFSETSPNYTNTPFPYNGSVQ
jgi:hypothetical protein